MIQDTNKMYSKLSCIALEWGGPIEKLWGSFTLSCDANSLRVTCQMAHYLSPIVCGLDKKSPIVASHLLVVVAAVAVGYENVINLVIDNYAQRFTVVPGALNLVQGPTNYSITIFSKWAFCHLNCNLQDIGFPRNWWMIFPQRASGGSNDGSTSNR
jgi:hypothetical protein